MYVDGDRAVILLNEWYGYKADPGKLAVQDKRGGLVALVDISDHTAPKLIAQYNVPGRISTSRYANGSTKNSLYVAAIDNGYYEDPNGNWIWKNESVVKSFDVTTAAMTPKSQINLGGYVTAIQGEKGVLLVARGPQSWNSQTSQVSIVDISDVNGAMTLRDTVTAQGYIRTQFHMDFRKDQLRVFSGPRWGGWGQQSYLQTWNATNKDKLTPIDVEGFGTNDALFGAVFLDDKAFAVTYLQQDPFHTFSIDANGDVEERTEFIVSGFNNYLRPVLGNTRIIGIGVNDQNGWKMAASLYDITDLDNPSPMITRAEVDSNSSWNWSAADWDHRAFSVLDNAVNATAPTGETEKGIILLPFSGYKFEQGKGWSLRSAVQIFTFSDQTLTRRGTMEHPDAVRRTIRLKDGTNNGANISDTVLSFHDQTDLDNPVKKSQIELAPNYVSIIPWGEYRLRIRNPDGYSYYWYGSNTSSKAEVIPASANADLAEPIASFDVPAGTRFFKVGNLFVTAQIKYGSWPYKTTITTYDLTDPTKPQQKGQFDTTDLPWYWTWYGTGLQATNNALVAQTSSFAGYQDLGPYNHCYSYLTGVPQWCWSNQNGCEYYTGYQECQTPEGENQYCVGGFAKCTINTKGPATCTEIPASTLKASGNLAGYCYDGTGMRYGYTPQYTVIDLSDPSNPKVAANKITFSPQDEAVAALPDGNDLLVTTKTWTKVPGDARPYARYYLRRVDMTNPSQPVIGPAINVPGTPVDVDGNKVITRDRQWGGRWQDPAIAKVKLTGQAATLENYHKLSGRQIGALFVDEHEDVIVSSSNAWAGYWYDRLGTKLDILSPQKKGPGYDLRSQTQIASWMNLTGASQHRLFFSVSGGSLVANIDDPTTPVAQAFFPAYGKPVIHKKDIIVAGGRLGVFQIDKNASNLLTAD
jgi:hypothetical protein